MAPLALLAFLTASPADLPKWEEVLSWMHRDVRTLTGTYEEWEIDGVSRDGEKSEGKIRRWLDGKRYRQELDTEGAVQMGVASDGDREWIVLRPAGIYVWNEDPADPLTATFTPPQEDPDLEAGSFRIDLLSVYDISISLKPLPTVKKLEEVGEERHLTVESKLPDRSVTIVFHFEKDKWLLKRMSGESDDKKSTLSLTRTKLERGKTFGSDVFALDAKVVEGLHELTGEDRDNFLKGWKKGRDGGGKVATAVRSWVRPQQASFSAATPHLTW